MIQGKKVIGLIPARGGSKGVPGKNIRDVGGKPLLAWTIETAKQSKYIDRLILSSDDKDIIAVAKQWDCEVPFVRPAELSTDEADTMCVVRHALGALDESFDYLVLLQPTSPLRTVEDIDGCIDRCVSNDLSACVSVAVVEKSPFWMFRADESGRLSPLFPDAPIPTRRQDSAPVFALNGAVYVAKCSDLQAGGNFLPSSVQAWIMPTTRSIDIDTETDLSLVQTLVQREEK